MRRMTGDRSFDEDYLGPEEPSPPVNHDASGGIRHVRRTRRGKEGSSSGRTLTGAGRGDGVSQKAANAVPELFQGGMFVAGTIFSVADRGVMMILHSCWLVCGQ